MTTSIPELDEQIAFWKTRPKAIESGIAAAFFAGMTLGMKIGRDQMRATPAIKQRAAPGSKPSKDEDRSPDCVLHSV